MFAQSNKNIPEIPLNRTRFPKLPVSSCRGYHWNPGNVKHSTWTGMTTEASSQFHKAQTDGFSEVRHKSFFLQRNEIIRDCIIAKDGLAFLWTHLLETIPTRVRPAWKWGGLFDGSVWSWGVNIKVFIAIRFNTRHNTLIFFNRKPFVPYTHRQSGPQARVLCFDTASS